MPIQFQWLLTEAGLDLSEIRLLRHRPADGIDPLAAWRRDRAVFEAYQSLQRIDRRAYFRGRYWASFAAVGSRTIFLGLYEVERGEPLPPGHFDPLHGRPPKHPCEIYKTTRTNILGEFAERLFIGWPAPRIWVQRADATPKIVTALYERDNDPPFPGYVKYRSPLSEVAGVPSTWSANLKAARGIYLLACPKTGEHYVGKAAGPDGFWGRWLDYVTSGHGGNVKLRSRDPSDYQVTILEVAGSAATAEDIDAMEALWKQKLLSREMGLNAN